MIMNINPLIPLVNPTCCYSTSPDPKTLPSWSIPWWSSFQLKIPEYSMLTNWPRMSRAIHIWSGRNFPFKDVTSYIHLMPELTFHWCPPWKSIASLLMKTKQSITGSTSRDHRKKLDSHVNCAIAIVVLSSSVSSFSAFHLRPTSLQLFFS